VTGRCRHPAYVAHQEDPEVRAWLVSLGWSSLAGALLLPILATPAASATPTPIVARVALGAHVPPSPYVGMQAFTRLEGLTGHLDIVALFQQWQGSTAGFHREWLDNARSGGHDVLLTWEPWDATRGVGQPRFSLAAIAHGAFDGYLRTWAQKLASYRHRVYLRPMHEMNGNWYPWAGGVNGNTPADYVAAWRHTHSIFAKAGAANVRWVWSPNAENVPATNAFEHYYPGAAYVDVLAMDGYNWGAQFPQYGGWRSFASIFAAPYARLARLGSQPIWVAETASSSVGGDKASWVRHMLLSVGFPRLRAIVWFDVDKEQDWRLSSPARAAGVVKQLQARYHAGKSGQVQLS
jgi:Glycosyl hydrolase family 26